MRRVLLILALLLAGGCTKGASPTEPCLRPDTIAPGDTLVFELKAAETRCVVVRFGAE